MYDITRDYDGKDVLASADDIEAALVAARVQIEDGEQRAYVFHPEYLYPVAHAEATPTGPCIKHSGLGHLR